MRELAPIHTSFMDSDMLYLLSTMHPPDLEGHRLMGGTALAMYLDHRKSTDFDFFSDKEVLRSELEKFRWHQGAEFHGETGMVDVVVPGKTKEVVLYFVDWELFGNPEPVHSPILTKGQIPIGHPVDVLVGKLAAASRRKAPRDFVDTAASSCQLPDALEEAIGVYISSPVTKESSRLDVAKTVRDYLFKVEYGLPKEDLESLAALAENLVRDVRGVERDRKSEWYLDR